ncbi:protein kinase domain-containing protein [Actinomadura miaoliensis]|uniref:Protein kinase domain-containing protein n=1 Tax=Actinomadura miaoliensis TaxID=430685 RepID=A0ABP7WRM1_9ACTN
MTGAPGWDGTGRTVRDEHARAIKLTRLLGAGGQGEVWAAGDRLAVKLVTARTPRAAERLRRRLRVVRRLDLDGIAVSRPIAMLAEPAVGYTMELLDDMVALRSLAAAPARQDLGEWYAATGGLRRRLRLLARAADALGTLHARGIVYGDPSPANILVSASVENAQMMLIDVDNLVVESVVPDASLVTPGYAAPELVTARMGVSSLSDAYSLAVMVFETLALVHPFLGDEVEEGEPELLDQAFSGELPWIDDPDDDSNRSSYGVNRQAVLTTGLRGLAERTFGAGRLDPVQRPTVAEWRTKLHAAADLTMSCPQCPHTYLAGAQNCPWCGAKAPDPLIALVHLATPGETALASAGEGLAVPRGRWLCVTARTARLAAGSDRPVAWLLWEPGARLVTRNADAEPLWLTPAGGGTPVVVEPGRELAVPAYADVPAWDLHFGHESQLHRVLRFRIVKGRQRP